MQFDFCVFQLHLVIRNLRSRGIAVRDGGIERALHVGIIQRREDLALFHVHAFVEEDARDAPGNFCCHRRATARGDVAAGIQQGRATCHGFLNRNYLHDRLLVAKSKTGSAQTITKMPMNAENIPSRFPVLAFFLWPLSMRREPRSGLRIQLRWASTADLRAHDCLLVQVYITCSGLGNNVKNESHATHPGLHISTA